MRVGRLTDDGIQRLGEWISAAKSDQTLAAPLHLLDTPQYSSALETFLDVKPRSFANRMEAGVFLVDLLKPVEHLDVERDRGLWSWLALFFLDALCPLVSGRRSPKESHRYILDPHDYQKYYRHLLATPYRIVRTYERESQVALSVLCTPVHKPGEVAEQLLSRQEWATNRTILGLATRLYYDAKSGKHRRRAGGKGPGSARRLSDVLQQFDLTWDLYSAGIDELASLLPAEFHSFLDAGK